MKELTRGERLPLAQYASDGTLQAGLSAQGLTLDFACFGLDAGGKLVDDRYMTFFNQPESPCGGVRAGAGKMTMPGGYVFEGTWAGGLLDGPLAFDNAISPEAAAIKGIGGPVAGQADILVVPDLEAGNMLAKRLSFLMNADSAGIVLGARVPIVLTSRADSVQSRLASCAVAAMIVDHRRRKAAILAE